MAFSTLSMEYSRLTILMRALLTTSLIFMCRGQNIDRMSAEDTSDDFTAGLQCQIYHGITICNGTNSFYENSTSDLEDEATKKKSELPASEDDETARSGGSFCAGGLDPSCTLLETTLCPTFLTNLVGQPRYIYQNPQVGVSQQIHLVACRQTACSRIGYGKCQQSYRQFVLLAVNPYNPHEILPDTFSVPGCCMCNSYTNPWGYGSGYGYGQGVGGGYGSVGGGYGQRPVGSGYGHGPVGGGYGPVGGGYGSVGGGYGSIGPGTLPGKGDGYGTIVGSALGPYGNNAVGSNGQYYKQREATKSPKENRNV